MTVVEAETGQAMAERHQVTRSIRRLGADDLDAALRIWNAAITNGESSYGPEPLDHDRLRGLLLDAPAPFESFVCERPGAGIVGLAGLISHTGRPIYGTVAELEVAVAPEYRHTGIGRALARHAIARAGELAFRSLLVISQPEPAFVPAWLTRLGFRNVGWLKGVLPVGAEWRDIMVFHATTERIGRHTRDPER